MARRNRNNGRKERIVMLASSVLVLTVLTVTGIFVQGRNRAEKEDYIVDLEAIEEGSGESANALMSGEDLDTLFAEVGTDDLDYDPSFQEANSAKVENTEDKKQDEQKTDGQIQDSQKKEEDKKEDEGVLKEKENNVTQETEKKEQKEEEEAGMFDESVDTAMSTTIQPALDFGEEESLVWPTVGDVLINYSMDQTIYFPTLDQYKYNPAIVISAAVGENIAAAADGRVVSVSYDPMIGNNVVMELGNGYELTYGQLDNITVSEGSYVSTGDVIGMVANPTKYYSTEGSNIYFKLLKDGEPVNPMTKLQ